MSISTGVSRGMDGWSVKGFAETNIYEITKDRNLQVWRLILDPVHRGEVHSTADMHWQGVKAHQRSRWTQLARIFHSNRTSIKVRWLRHADTLHACLLLETRDTRPITNDDVSRNAIIYCVSACLSSIIMEAQDGTTCPEPACRFFNAEVKSLTHIA